MDKRKGSAQVCFVLSECNAQDASHGIYKNQLLARSVLCEADNEGVNEHMNGCEDFGSQATLTKIPTAVFQSSWSCA